jgi:hypothetical protein
VTFWDAPPAPPDSARPSGQRLRFAVPSLDYASLVGTPSSSPAQDNALSRHERGFESRWGRYLTKRSYRYFLIRDLLSAVRVP